MKDRFGNEIEKRDYSWVKPTAIGIGIVVVVGLLILWATGSL